MNVVKLLSVGRVIAAACRLATWNVAPAASSGYHLQSYTRQDSNEGRLITKVFTIVLFYSDPHTGEVPGKTRDRNMRSKIKCSACPAIHTA
jgi:hypothetical protein